MHILVIEDDPKIAASVCSGLQAEGFRVTTAGRGEEGYFELESSAVDLVVLDWMLPGRDGMELLKLLRQKNAQLPVIMVTAKDAIKDRVSGLEAGADDYLVKPFAFSELLARVRALIRRGNQGQTLRYRVDDVDLDLVTRKVSRAGLPIELTGKEFEFLAFLMKYPSQIVSREMVARSIWPGQLHNTSLDNVIDVHLGRLRKKIDLSGKAKLIHTVRSLGFFIGKSDSN